MDLWQQVQLENSEQVIYAHKPDQCEGRACTIHNRTDHHMRSWPQSFRFDKSVMERICEHGVGHPDPDEYPYHHHSDSIWIHGCDGCCSSKAIEYPDELNFEYFSKEELCHHLADLHRELQVAEILLQEASDVVRQLRENPLSETVNDYANIFLKAAEKHRGMWQLKLLYLNTTED